MVGYTKAYRERFKHKLFKAGRHNAFCRGYAWDWMIANAAWKDTQTLICGRGVTLKRGQFSHSYRFMAEAWGWSLGAVQRFMVQLQTDTMIDTATDTGQLVITICNYDKYQSDGAYDDTIPQTRDDTAAIQQRYREEEGKEGKKVETEVSTKRAAAALAHLSPIVGHDLAAAFIDHRNALKAPMTAGAAKIIAKKLAAMSDPGAAVTTSIERGWKGVFPPDQKVTPFRGRNYGERVDDAFQAAAARLAKQPFD